MIRSGMWHIRTMFGTSQIIPSTRTQTQVFQREQPVVAQCSLIFYRPPITTTSMFAPTWDRAHILHHKHQMEWTLHKNRYYRAPKAHQLSKDAGRTFLPSKKPPQRAAKSPKTCDHVQQCPSSVLCLCPQDEEPQEEALEGLIIPLPPCGPHRTKEQLTSLQSRLSAKQ